MISSLRIVALSMLVVGSGCTELPEISAGTCGNGIVEAGEDCDSKDPSCRPAGKPLECRRDCSIDEATGERRACDPGWGCGLDEICRAPSGLYETRGDTTHEISISAEVGDFDGDGRDDVLAAEPARSVAYFQDSEGRTSTATAVPGFAPDAFAAALAGETAPNEPASFVYASDSISVARGNVDRSFRHVAFAPFDIDQATFHYATFDAVTQPVGPLAGEEIIGFKAVSDTRAKLVEARLNHEVYEIDYAAGATLALTGDLDVASPCHELATATSTWDSVGIHHLCTGGPGNWGWSPDAGAPKVTLPSGWVLWSGPLYAAEPAPVAALARLNADPYLDLLVRAVPDTGNPDTYVEDDAKLFAAFGVGNASFHSDPQTLPVLPASGDGAFAPLDQSFVLGGFVKEVPLAIGTISADSVPDFVTREFVFVSAPGGSCGTASFGYICFKPENDPWIFAAIGEFNGAGTADVVAVSGNGTGLEFFSGFATPQGSGFNRTFVPAVGLINGVAVGDFDGDFIADFALREQRGFAELERESLSIAWGRVLGPPEPPVSVARFQQIVQLAAGHLASFEDGELDGIQDIGLLSGVPDDENPGSPPKELSAAVFYGRGDRLLQSPFALVDGDVQYAATRSVAGRFDADPHLDIAAISRPESSGGGVPPPEEAAHKLWLLPAQTGVFVHPLRVTAADVVDPRFVPCGTRATAVDLDGDQIDELVVFGLGAGTGKGLVTVARAAPAGDTSVWSDVQHHETDEIVIDGFVSSVVCNAALAGVDTNEGDFLLYGGEAFAVDLDRNGLKEIVTLGYDISAGQRPMPVLVIYPNLGNGSLDVAGRIRHSLPRLVSDLFGPNTGPGATAVTAIQADSDPELELVLGNLLHPTLVEVSFGDDGAPHAVTEGVPMAGFATEESAIAQPENPGDILWSVSLVAGDMDGDGVQDFASAGPAGVRILYGIPVIR